MTNVNVPLGMLDDLPPTPRAQTSFEKDVFEYLLATGAPNPELAARVTDPSARKAFEASVMERRLVDWPHLGMYRGENAALSSCPEVVFLGCSITEIWQHSDSVLFSNGIIGRGISGQTSPQLLLRFYPDVIALRPKAVHIMCGSNDIAGNTGPTARRDYQNNILAMLDLALVNGIAVLLGSIPPSVQFKHRPDIRPAGRIAELNGWLRSIATMRGATYVDYFSALADADGALPAQYSNDGLHPNRAGYDVMRPVALAAIHTALETVGAD